MVKQPEILKVIIDGGELDAAINQLRKDIPAATNLTFSVLRNVVSVYRSREDQKRKIKNRKAAALADSDGDDEKDDKVLAMGTSLA
jgi:hypothetical protein